MALRYCSRLVVLAAVLCLAIPAVAQKGGDRKPPTSPSPLRVTGVTPGSVSLAWNRSTDNSGSFQYVLLNITMGAAGRYLPQTQTTYTWTGGLENYQSHSFIIFAQDFSYNRSQVSNVATATLPVDAAPPTKPVITVSDVGPIYIVLNWSSSDDGTIQRYTLFQDGVAVRSNTTATSATLYYLDPGTTYVLSVQVSDGAGNRSQSDPVAVSTEPDPNDQTPPTTPANLYAQGISSDPEFYAFWNASTDNVDLRPYIKYYIFVNGVLSDFTIGTTHSLNYGEMGRLNTVEVYAEDTAGNVSAVAATTIQF